MLKGLAKLWLRGVKQAAKAQTRQNKKFVKALLVAPAAKKVIKPVGLRTEKSGISRARSRNQSGNKATTAPPARLPGRWLASFYSTILDDRTLPVRRMSYRLYLPDTLSTVPMPLLVMLHGCEQTAEQFSQGTRFNHLAQEKGFAVLYPQQSLRSHPNRCWQWYDKATQAGGGDVALIAGVIEKVARQYAIDRTRIYIGGLSAGASMASIVALNYPHLIAAVGMHSGTVFGAGHSRMGAYSVMQNGASSRMASAIQDVVDKESIFPGMPAILIHGQEDKVVRAINMAQSAYQFKVLNQLDAANEKPVVVKPGGKVGRKNAAHPYRIYDHAKGRKLILRVCDISGLEHAWSGGDCQLRFNSCAGPDASKLMWNFFSRHRRLA